MIRTRQLARQRGVVLMVVLGLLTMFMLIALSFVMSSTQHRLSALASNRYEQVGNMNESWLYGAMMQVVRGSNNPTSVMGPHSLLEDMYGNESIVGVVTAVRALPFGAVSGNQSQLPLAEFWEMRVYSFGNDRQPGMAGIDDDGNGIIDDVVEAVQGGNPIGSDPTEFYLGLQPPPGSTGSGSGYVDNIEGYYGGRVITMLDGPARHCSSHIVRSYIPALGAASNLLVRVFDNGGMPQVGDRVVINGLPYNGAGFGYLNPNSSNDLLNSNVQTLIGGMNAGKPFALLPNPTDSDYRTYLATLDRAYTYGGSFNPAGVFADEDYDAPDYQNMLLAAVEGGSTKSPSLHRADLVAYWINALGNNPSTPGAWASLPAGQGTNSERLRQKIILRPDPQDHMDDGTKPWDPTMPEWSNNPAFDPVNGPWDVDNTGNGEPDSIWVDLGAPVQTGPDGRRFKTLFAILCIDLDGRFNLNVHGNSTHYARVVPNNAYPASGNPVPTLHDDAASTGTPPISVMPPNDLIFTAPVDGGNVLQGYVRGANVSMTTLKLEPPNPDPLYKRGLLALTAYGGALPLLNRGAQGSYLFGGPYVGGLPLSSGGAGNGSATGVHSGWPTSYTNGFSSVATMGHGMSVAEVNLAPLMSPPALRGDASTIARSTNAYRDLLEGVTQAKHSGDDHDAYYPAMETLAEGRYGEYSLLNFLNEENARANRYPRIQPSPGATNMWGPNTVPQGRVDDNRPLMAGPGLIRPDSTGLANDSPSNLNNPISLSRGNMYYEGSFFLNNPFFLASGSPFTTNNYRLAGNYGSHPDPFGHLIPAIDFRGMTYPGYRLQDWLSTTTSIQIGVNELLDDPWELDVSAKANNVDTITPLVPNGLNNLYNTPINNRPITGYQPGNPHYYKFGDDRPPPAYLPVTYNRDNPFNYLELEHLLRYTAPELQSSRGNTRLYKIFGSGGAYVSKATTESWDLPCPNITYTPEMRAVLSPSTAANGLPLPSTNLTIVDLLRAKLAAANLILKSDPPGGGYASQPLSIDLATMTSHTHNMARSHLYSPDPVYLANSTSLPMNVPTFRLLAPDLLMGLRMDLNRPFGNAIDDSPADPNSPNNAPLGPSVVDRPPDASQFLATSSTEREQLWQNIPLPFGFSVNSPRVNNGLGLPFDFNRGSTGDGDPNSSAGVDMFSRNMARQDLAKNLYILAMMFADTQYQYPTAEPAVEEMFGGGSLSSLGPVPPNITAATYASDSKRRLRNRWLQARRVAQWAINAVDFRDRDAIMTPFEFDMEPFINNSSSANDGSTWDVDGLITTNENNSVLNTPTRGIVWGMEYPELLITETFASHDKRIADTSYETQINSGVRKGSKTNRASPTAEFQNVRVYNMMSKKIETDDNESPDPSWDQVRPPRGTTIIELYATGRNSLPDPANSNSEPNGRSTGVIAENELDLTLFPQELYDIASPSQYPPNATVSTTPINGRRGLLDLSRVTPGGYPVWRLAITEYHRGRAYGASNSGKVHTTIRERMHVPVDYSQAPYTSAQFYDYLPDSTVLDQYVPPDIDTGSYTPDANRYFNSEDYDWIQLSPFARGATTASPPALQTTTTDGRSIMPSDSSHFIKLDRFVYFAPPPNWLSSSRTNGRDFCYAPTLPTAAPTTGPGVPPQKLLLEPGSYAIVGPKREFIQEWDTTVFAFTGSTAWPLAPLKSAATNSGYTQPPLATTGMWYGGAAPYSSGGAPWPVVQPGLGIDPSPSAPLPNYPNVAASATPYPPIALPTDFSINGPAATDIQVKPPLSIPVASSINSSIGTTAPDNFQSGTPIPYSIRGLNISEPLDGYLSNINGHDVGFQDAKTYRGVGGAGGLMVTDPASGNSVAYQGNDWFQRPLDEPFDMFNDQVFGLGTDKYLQNGTHLDIRTALLQRLANPLIDPDPVTNPYLTIDWMPIDLTIYNGEVVDEMPVDIDKTPPTQFVGIPQLPELPDYVMGDQGSITIPNTGYFGVSYLTVNTPYVGDPNGMTYSNVTVGGNGPPPYSKYTLFASRERGIGPQAVLKQRFDSIYGGVPTANNDLRANLWASVSTSPLDLQSIEPYLPSFSSPDAANMMPTASFPNGWYPNITTTAPFDQCFRQNMHHSLGYVNSTYGLPISAANLQSFLDCPKHISIQYLGAPAYQDVALGAPRWVPKPFPWLTWNNRPFANAMELLIVPASSPSRFTTEFTLPLSAVSLSPPVALQQAADPYADYYPPHVGFEPLATVPMYNQLTTYVNTWDPNATSSGGGARFQPFGHLLNFFHSSSPANAHAFAAALSGGGLSSSQMIAPSSGNYYRLLEYVHVPSRFSGTEDLIANWCGNRSPGYPQNKTMLANVGGFSPTDADTQVFADAPLSVFRPPFNRVSRYREPGKININTFVGSNAEDWGGVTNYMKDYGPTWMKYIGSRTVAPVSNSASNSLGACPNYVSSPSPYVNLFNPQYPAYRHNPFRSFSSPLNVADPVSRVLPRMTNPSAQAMYYVDASLLRTLDWWIGGTAVGAPPDIRAPLFEVNDRYSAGRAGSMSNNNYEFQNANRSPYFRYQPLIKTGNTFTTRSNVYGVWITSGYFEVEPIQTTDPNQRNYRDKKVAPYSNPDGFRLVRELGLEEGTSTRHRAFMVIDRSLPVAFQRGENYNVDASLIIQSISE